MQRLLIVLVRSLKSSHDEGLKNPLLCEDYNKIADIHMAVSVVYDTFQKFLFLHACSYSTFLHFIECTSPSSSAYVGPSFLCLLCRNIKSL